MLCLNFVFLCFKFTIKITVTTTKNKDRNLAKDKFEPQHVYYRKKKTSEEYSGEVLKSKYTVVFGKLALWFPMKIVMIEHLVGITGSYLSFKCTKWVSIREEI